MADTSKITLKQLKDAMNKAKDYTDNEIAGVTGVSKVEPEELDMPKVFFYGNALPTTKDNVNLTMDYISNSTKFSSFVKLKCQGTSSMSYAKKNFTVAMYSDESRATKLKKDFKGWGAQSKFCLKANYVDTTHTRNISGARIAYDMVKSRPDSPFKQQLLQCPRNGAVDGFPIKVYFNGEFYGIYTWNIPKDGWMFNMEESNVNHMVLCAEKNNDNTNVSDDILRCEFRKEWDGTDGNSWSIEFGTYSDALKNSFNRCVNFVMTATDEEFKANIGNYFDLYSLLDYYCFTYFVAHIDGLAKNMLMVTYDGTIWGASLYDMDSIYGADWNGTSFKIANLQCPEQYQETNSLLWQRIENCFSAELYARYLELRQGALSLSNIIKHVEEIYDVIPDRVFADEKAKWTSLPGVNNNTITRFRNYMKDRAVYVDAQMEEIGTKIPCTGIVLSADTLSFTTTDTQTLSVVVSPDNTTDAVNWSVSPSGIATVNNGVITPVANGECTITATCGSHSDTCTVTVALPVVECTSITLDKHELVISSSTSEQPSEETLDITQNTTAGTIIRGSWAIGANGGISSFGNINASTSDTATDFIPFTSNNTLTISQPSSQWGCGVVAYDSNKHALACYTANNTWEAGDTQSNIDIKTLTVNVSAPPSDTAYVRICFNLNDLSRVTVVRKYTNNGVGSHQLTATVTPENCTQPVVWSVSPQGIVTVDNGLVTAVTNGEATVTATCGTQSATCAVTVSGIILSSTNLLDGINIEQGYLKLEDGSFVASSVNTDMTSDFIPFIGDDSTIYKYEFSGGKYLKVCFYNSSKEFLFGTNTGTIPETVDNAKYSSCSFYSHDSIVKGKGVAYIRCSMNQNSVGSAIAKRSIVNNFSDLLVPEGECPEGHEAVVINETSTLSIVDGFTDNPSGVNGNTIFETALPVSNYGVNCISPRLCIKTHLSGFNSASYAGVYNRMSCISWSNKICITFTLDSSKVGTTLDEVKAWLADNPITIYVPTK